MLTVSMSVNAYDPAGLKPRSAVFPSWALAVMAVTVSSRAKLMNSPENLLFIRYIEAYIVDSAVLIVVHFIFSSCS